MAPGTTLSHLPSPSNFRQKEPRPGEREGWRPLAGFPARCLSHCPGFCWALSQALYPSGLLPTIVLPPPTGLSSSPISLLARAKHCKSKCSEEGAREGGQRSAWRRETRRHLCVWNMSLAAPPPWGSQLGWGRLPGPW